MGRIKQKWDVLRTTQNSNIISLSRHEQVCLLRLLFGRYCSHHRATQMIILHVFKGNVRSWTETKLADLGEKYLSNSTN